MEAEELVRKRQILKDLRARRHERDVQAARFGVSADPIINSERTELAQQIAELEREISEAGYKEQNVSKVYTKDQSSSIRNHHNFAYVKVLAFLLIMYRANTLCTH